MESAVENKRKQAVRGTCANKTQVQPRRQRMRALRAALFTTSALMGSSALTLAGISTARALDLTWTGSNPDYLTASNWNPTGVPGTNDRAIFDVFGTTTLVITSAAPDVGAWVFNKTGYVIGIGQPTGSINFVGAGIITNGNSASIQNDHHVAFMNSSSADSVFIANNSTSTLEFHNTATLATGTVDNAGTVSFFDTATAGGGHLGTSLGTVNFNNSSTAGSATITNTSGAVNFNDTSTAANASITSNGTMTFAGSSTAANANITNNNTLIFAGTSTAGNASITNVHNLFFQGQSSVGDAAITNAVGATTDFSQSSGPNNDHKINVFSLTGAGSFFLGQNELTVGRNNADATISGVIADGSGGGTGGSLVKTGTGKLTLSSNSTYTGATTINSGVMVVSGSLTGTSNVNVNAGTSLNVQGSVNATGNLTANNSSVTVGGAATAASGVTLNASTFTVNGSLGSSGNVNVNNGSSLVVNGSVTASGTLVVNSGGSLSGAGTLSKTQINSGGSFVAGNGTAGSSTTINGNLAFQSGAQYVVNVSPATTSNTLVFGNASLNGTANASFAPGAHIAKHYAIILATGNVSGTFSSLNTSNMPSGFTSSLSYGSNFVSLDLAMALGTNGASGPSGNGGNNQQNLNINQQNTGSALINAFNNNGGIAAAFAGLTPQALTQISGEGATGAQQTTFNAMNQFMGVVTDPFIAGRGDAVADGNGATPFADENDDGTRGSNERDAYAAVSRKAPVAGVFAQRWSVWAAGYGGSQTTDGNAAVGSSTATSRIFGTVVGADYRISPDAVAGFALGGGGTNFSVANGLGGGRSDLFQAATYFRANAGAAYLSGALAYGWQDVTTDRTVMVAGIDQLRAHFNAGAYSGRVESGYRFVTPWLGGIGFTPYVAGQATAFVLPAYSESTVVGANTFALSYGAKNVTVARSEFGLRTDKSFAMADGVLTLRGRAAWAHDFNPDRAIAATFQTLPGASFVVNGATPAPDAALATASAEIKWLGGLSAAATFEGEFSNVTRSYAGKGVVRYAW